MSDLDEVSLSIGKLTGQVESLGQNIDHMISWVKESNRRFEDVLQTHTTNDANNFEELKRRIAGLDKFKARVYTVASVCSLCFTAGMNYLLNKPK